MERMGMWESGYGDLRAWDKTKKNICKITG
jgi:hypothetical protein